MSDGARGSGHERWEVAIVGAGPVGLLLAGQLAERHVRVVVLERADAPATLAKANGIVGRTAVDLHRRKILAGPGLRVLRPPRFQFGSLVLRLGIGPLSPGNPLHILPIPQLRLEELLQARAIGLGAHLRRGLEVTGFAQDVDGVTVDVHSGDAASTVRARFLVGCDGAHSLVRKQAGIDFPGYTSNTIVRIARVTIPPSKITRVSNRSQVSFDIAGVGRFAAMTPNPLPGGRFSIAPVAALDRTAPADLYIISVQEPRHEADVSDVVTVDALRASIRRVVGADLPFTEAADLRSTVGNSRQADAYRVGRVFLAGDAAHLYNAGGTALNIGLQDALDLADRFASVLRDGASEAALDGYHTSRHAAGLRALQHTRAQAALSRNDDDGRALRETLGPAITTGRAARRLARLLEQP